MTVSVQNNFFVYLHVKQISGEPFYVGKGLFKRAFNTKRRSVWWNSIKDKHGFDVIFLESEIDEKTAFEREIYWIKRIGRKQLNKGPLINQTDGGEGTSGRIMSEECKKQLAERLKGNTFVLGKKTSDETKEKLRLSKLGEKNPMFGKESFMKGKKHTHETRLKMKESIAKSLINNPRKKGVIKFSDEAKKRHSELKIEFYKFNEVSNKVHVPVRQLDVDGNFIKEFDSHHQACKEIGCLPKRILQVCKGIYKTHKNFKWEFNDTIKR